MASYTNPDLTADELKQLEEYKKSLPKFSSRKKPPYRFFFCSTVLSKNGEKYLADTLNQVHEAVEEDGYEIVSSTLSTTNVKRWLIFDHVEATICIILRLSN
jgi:hypothetical protein